MEIVSKSYLSIYGVISTYILNEALTRCNANVSFHIPDRIKDSVNELQEAIKDGDINTVYFWYVHNMISAY